jgi:hypothetical protein
MGGGGPRLSITLASPIYGEGDHVSTSNPCLPPLAGGGGPRSGGRGCLKAVDARRAGIRTLSKERAPSNIKGHPPSFTIVLIPPSVSLRSPRMGMCKYKERRHHSLCMSSYGREGECTPINCHFSCFKERQAKMGKIASLPASRGGKGK